MLQWGVAGDPEVSDVDNVGGERFWLAGGPAVSH